jgi:hypothetical protein
MPPSGPIHRNGERGERRVGAWVLRGVVACGVAGIVCGAWRMSTRSSGAADVRLGRGAVVMRGTRRVAAIERVTPARGRGRLPLYLAPARGPVIDSARVGALVALLAPGTDVGREPVVMLVPRDSIKALVLVGRLVVTPGEPGLLVFGARGDRP